MTTRELAHMTVEDLVAEKETLEDANHSDRHGIERRKAEIALIDAHLFKMLGDGEVVQAPSGRLLLKTVGALGAARVDEAAIDEHASRLPEDLRPRSVSKYPGVVAIRQAAKDGRLPDGVKEGDLLVSAPEGSALRWRTISDDTR